ncbi:uncharacterized protein LOC126792117 [Argentina anserina]|uniref:uncharacterized protein LOC126792117 n=1 Tax=Argentina anserina TaxID=57926 RepID=UPI00217646B9|nr:uncharacterized protein LOC126792117 [Potentilla anserina]
MRNEIDGTPETTTWLKKVDKEKGYRLKKVDKEKGYMIPYPFPYDSDLDEKEDIEQESDHEGQDSLADYDCADEEYYNIINMMENSLKQCEVNAKLNDLWIKDEKFWHQRSRVKWLTTGDSNSRFFHLTTLQCRQRNRILRIQNFDGAWLTGETMIRKEFEDHFQKLFTSSGPRNWGNSLSGIRSGISVEINAILLALVTLEEVKCAIDQLGALKALGPDGFPGLFYQKYWGIVNEVVVNSSRDFMKGGVDLHSLNLTNIVLNF